MDTDKKLKGFYGMGRRKTAVAQVLLTDDPKSQTVNGKDFLAYFPTESLQKVCLRALTATSQLETFGVKAKIQGGGKSSQAEALTLAIARALLAHDEGFRKQLRKLGYLTRDDRMKERKKPGLKGARRAPQFSKR